MAERPILFSGEMVRAILDGRKTQTRRVVKRTVREEGVSGVATPRDGYTAENIPQHFRCPYGVPGDRLWVRETFQYESKTADYEWDVRNCVIRYRATEPDAGPWLTAEDDLSEAWRPSIHMPRWASRLTLGLTAVRVERVQDITAEDCIAEGLSTTLREHDASRDLCDQYRDLWDSLNAKRAPWSSNPWVWVLTFKRARQAGEDRE